jgi:ElaB/YqjD/DUF883 family membrane-anchored ribosome-binding protein
LNWRIEVTPSTLNVRTHDKPVRDNVVDAVRHAAHASHEARLLKTIAADAVENGVYATKRAIKVARRWTHSASDVRDEAAYRVKREPFKFVGLALGVGIQLGLILGWVGRKAARRTGRDSSD